jgi:hypothetical protein
MVTALLPAPALRVDVPLPTLVLTASEKAT